MDTKPTYEILAKKVRSLEYELAVMTSKVEALRNTNKVLESQIERLTLDLEKEKNSCRDDRQAHENTREALEACEKKYNLHFENVSEVIYFIDATFRFRNISPSVKSEWGYEAEEIIGKQIAELSLLAPSSLENMSSHAMLMFSGQEVEPAVYEFISKDGRTKSAEVCSTPIIEDENVVGIIGVARNITERRAVEEERLEKQRLKGVIEMARTVSYELNQPIQAIFSHAELMMLDMDEKSPIYEKAKTIQNQVYELAKTIKHLGHTTQYVVKETAPGETIIDLEKSANANSEKDTD